MKNTKKGFIVPLLIAIIAVLVIGGGVYVFEQNKPLVKTDTVVDTGTQTQPVSIQQNPTVPVVTNPTAGWKIYTDVNQGFSFKYPSSWTYQKFSCNLDGVAFYPTGSNAVTCGMDSPVAPIYLYPKSGGQQTTSASLVLSTQFSSNSSYKEIYNQMVKTFTSSIQSTGVTDANIVAIIFPSSQWNQHSEIIPGNKMAVVYRPLGQTGLPILVINSIQRSSNGNDALVTVVFYGADSATEVKFVHNLKSQPVELTLPDQLPFGPVKTTVSDSGFNPNGNFFVTYSDVGGETKTVNYQVNGGVIIETGGSSVLPTACVDQQEGVPVITSLSSNSVSVGTRLAISGCNFAGFESDLNVWIENSQGVKGILYSEPGSTAKLMNIVLKPQACQTDESYRGLPCASYLNLIPGTYKIYTIPWGKKSNEATFTIK